MAWQVLPPYEMEYRGSPYRFFEIEADNEFEYAALMEKTLGKGWEVWVTGTRPDRPEVRVAMFCKPLLS